MNQPEVNPTPVLSPFWPLCLLALSLALFLAWQVTQAAQQHLAGLRLADQQAVLAGQAAQTETRFQSMMVDLITLAKTDPEAQAIVTRYRISFTPNQPSAPSLDAVLPETKRPSAAAPKEAP